MLYNVIYPFWVISTDYSCIPTDIFSYEGRIHHLHPILMSSDHGSSAIGIERHHVACRSHMGSRTPGRRLRNSPLHGKKLVDLGTSAPASGHKAARWTADPSRDQSVLPSPGRGKILGGSTSLKSKIVEDIFASLS